MSNSKTNVLEQLRRVGAMQPPESVSFKGESFWIRRMNGKERHALSVRRKELNDEDKDFSDADWAAAGLCTQEGEAVFPTFAEATELLHQLDGELQTFLANRVLSINGFTEDAAKKASTSQTQNSGTSLPTDSAAPSTSSSNG